LDSCPSLTSCCRSLCGAVCTLSLCAFCCEGQGCMSQEIRFGLWKRVRALSGNAQQAVNAPYVPECPKESFKIPTGSESGRFPMPVLRVTRSGAASALDCGSDYVFSLGFNLPVNARWGANELHLSSDGTWMCFAILALCIVFTYCFRYFFQTRSRRCFLGSSRMIAARHS
jgi:hypothetical protein